eukprot:scaffold150935_cov32-Tisochrysis_lutea.AAC.5
MDSGLPSRITSNLMLSLRCVAHSASYKERIGVPSMLSSKSPPLKAPRPLVTAGCPSSSSEALSAAAPSEPSLAAVPSDSCGGVACATSVSSSIPSWRAAAMEMGSRVAPSHAKWQPTGWGLADTHMRPKAPRLYRRPRQGRLRREKGPPRGRSSRRFGSGTAAGWAAAA